VSSIGVGVNCVEFTDSEKLSAFSASSGGNFLFRVGGGNVRHSSMVGHVVKRVTFPSVVGQ
jgi:hypothetical protein